MSVVKLLGPVLTAAVVIGLVVGLCRGVVGASAESTPAVVAWISDGDTLVVREEAADLGRVRLLGIDAPELAHGGRPAQCWSSQALRVLATLAPVGATVRLVAVAGQHDRDSYGRLLRYVEVEGRDVSEQLLTAGAAHLQRMPAASLPPLRQAVYAAAAQQARAEHKGLWGACP